MGSKGEIFPPKEIRKGLGLSQGSKMDIVVEDGKSIVQRTLKAKDLSKMPLLIEITLEEFHKFRK